MARKLHASMTIAWSHILVPVSTTQLKSSVKIYQLVAPVFNYSGRLQAHLWSVPFI